MHFMIDHCTLLSFHFWFGLNYHEWFHQFLRSECETFNCYRRCENIPQIANKQKNISTDKILKRNNTIRLSDESTNFPSSFISHKLKAIRLDDWFLKTCFLCSFYDICSQTKEESFYALGIEVFIKIGWFILAGGRHEKNFLIIVFD